MKNFIDKLRATIPDFLIVRAFSLLVLLFAVRFALILYDLKFITKALARQTAQIMRWEIYFCAAMVFVALFFMQRLFNRVPGKQKAGILVGYSLFFCIPAILEISIKKFNYLYLAISNSGALSELSSFIVLDLFFRPPYLFWVLMWFAITPFIFKGKYGEKFLFIAWGTPIFLMNYYYILRFVDFFFFFTVGITALIGAILKQKAISFKIPFLSIIFLIIAYFGFANTPFHEPVSVTSLAVLALVCWIMHVLYLNFIKKINTPEAAAFSWFIPLIAGICFSLPVTGFFLGRCDVYTWMIISSLHYMAAPIFISIFCLILTVIISRFSLKFSKVIFDLSSLFLIIFYVVDAIFSHKSGMHIDLIVVKWALGVNDLNILWDSVTSVLTFYNLAAFLSLPFVYYLTLFLLKSRTSTALQDSNVRYMLIISIVSSGILFLPELDLCVYEGLKDPVVRLSYSIGKSLGIGESRISPEQLVKTNNKLGTGFNKITPINSNPTRKYNLILAILESSHSRYCSLFGEKDKTWPEMAKFENKMELYPNFYSNFQESCNARIACLSGIYPPYKALITYLNPKFSVKILSNILKNYGYENYFYLSSYFDYTNLRAFVNFRGFDYLYDMNNMPNVTKNNKWVWGIKEYAVVNNICNLIQKKADSGSEKPFFCLYVPVFPHEPFVSQLPGYAKFNREEYIASGTKIGVYKNCLLYMDSQLARIQKKLEETGLANNTIFALVSDHGDLVGENGRFGHGWDLDPLLTNVPFIVIDPRIKNKKVNPVLGSQVDILPTLLHSMGIKTPPNELYQGRDLHTIAGERKDPIYLFSMQDMAVVEDKKYYLFKGGKLKGFKAYKIQVDTSVPKTSYIPIKSPDAKVAKKYLQNCIEVGQNQRTLINNYSYYKNSLRNYSAIE